MVEAAVLGAAGLAILLIVVAHHARTSILIAVTGFSAAFLDLQVFRVHVFSGLAVITLLALLAAGQRMDWRPVLLVTPAVLLVAATVLIGDLVNNPLLAAQLLLLAIPATLLAGVLDNERRSHLLHGLLAGITLSSLVAVLQFLGVLDVELIHQDISSLGRPSGLYPEPDWLGLMSALGLLLSPRVRNSRAALIAVLSLNSAALLLAFARAAWVALALTVVLSAVVKALQVRRDEEKRIPLGALLLVGATLAPAILSSDALRSDLSLRFDQILGGGVSDVSANARLSQIDSLVTLADSAPWYGHGLSASGRVGVSGLIYRSGTYDNNVASNWILGMWVDAHYLAVPLVLLMLFTSALSFLRLEGRLLAVVLLNSLFSNALFFPVVWVCLALALRAIFVADDQAEEPPERPTSARRRAATSTVLQSR
jgi:hypothetical protein